MDRLRERLLEMKRQIVEYPVPLESDVDHLWLPGFPRPYPSEREVSAIRGRLATLRQQVSHIRTQIDTLLQEEAQLLAQIRTEEEAIPSIQTLPDEILGEIFQFVVPTPLNDATIPMQPEPLTWVCRRWYHAAVAISSLWNDLRFSDYIFQQNSTSLKGEMIEFHIARRVARSRGRGLRVLFRAAGLPVLDRVHRWRERVANALVGADVDFTAAASRRQPHIDIGVVFPLTPMLRTLEVRGARTILPITALRSLERLILHCAPAVATSHILQSHHILHLTLSVTYRLTTGAETPLLLPNLETIEVLNASGLEFAASLDTPRLRTLVVNLPPGSYWTAFTWTSDSPLKELVLGDLFFNTMENFRKVLRLFSDLERLQSPGVRIYDSGQRLTLKELQAVILDVIPSREVTVEQANLTGSG